jgi:HD-GYP domain-containing protein (c-di-GMP phosphodiesterase class II)
VSIAVVPEITLPTWSVPAPAFTKSGAPVRIAEVVSALSYALDMSTGQPVGHSVRACIIGMRIASELGLPVAAQRDLYYALLLKDAGCSSNASKMFRALGADDIKAKREVKTTDWTRLSWETVQYALLNVASGKPFLERVRTLLRVAGHSKENAKEATKIRCERGATVARLIGLPEPTANGIASLDEHWDGSGYPEGLRETEIPITSRIILLAQTLEIYFASKGAEAAIEVARARSARWFDPDLVKAASSLAARNGLWTNVASEKAFSLGVELDPAQKTMAEGDATLDAICLAFAQIVDAKSPFTYRHSNGVANAAVAIARTLQLEPKRILFLRHAALLHDLGKMSLSDAILENPGELNGLEWQAMRRHPFYTWKILNAISGFGQMSEVAASHHEKLDGSGYFRGLVESQLSLEARILAVADIFDALSANRPYRDALPLEAVFKIMRKDAPHKLDAACVEALEISGAACDQTFVDLVTLSRRIRATDQSGTPSITRSQKPAART